MDGRCARVCFSIFYYRIMKINIKPDTPLSELFRENHHNELKEVIESWRKYLIDDDPSIDALKLSHFEFDKKRIRSKNIYASLLPLEHPWIMRTSLRQLAYYFSCHSNLGKSFKAIYQQIKNYRQDWL